VLLDAPAANVGEALAHHGFVQIDPINVCGRMHDLILRTRVAGYREGDLFAHLHGGDVPLPAEARAAIEQHLPRHGILTALPVDAWPYLHAAMAREPIEQFRVLFLDTRNRLIADEKQARGTVNHTPVYPREVVKRCLDLGATAIILVHNHPSGDPTPSRADIEMTAEVKAAAGALGIVLHDHLIIGNGRQLSFRREGLL
jgi:DNA repair protein RadC